MQIEKVKFWTREYAESRSNCLFIFGDNIEDQKTNYIPTSTQAVIRGLPNAIGVCTKKNRRKTESSYFNTSKEDKSLFLDHLGSFLIDYWKIKDRFDCIILPEDGIGTGASMLETKAPSLFIILKSLLKQIEDGQL